MDFETTPKPALDIPVYDIPLTDEEITAREQYETERPIREREWIQADRRAAYRDNADPLFFKWQAGEATEQEWLDARKQVVNDNPYPDTQTK